MDHLAPGNRSSTIWIKIGCEAYVFKAISSTKKHEEMFKKEVEHLVLIWVLETANDPKWGTKYFLQPKTKSNLVSFLSDYINLNMQLKREPYPMS